MNIFITGGTGFIGRSLIKELSHHDHHLYCISRKKGSSLLNNYKNITWLEGSLEDNWSKELSKCEILIHLAAAGVNEEKDNWEKCLKTNVMESLNLFLDAAKSKVRRIVYIGTGFEYGQSSSSYEFIPNEAPLKPKNAYAASKAAFSSLAWGLGVDYSLEMIILRPFYVYGPGEKSNRFWPQLIKAGKEGQNFLMTKGDQINDYFYISDAAKKILKLSFEAKVIRGYPKIFNLGSGNINSLRNFAKNEWERINAKGDIKFGAINYRKSENMRYVPKV